VSCVVPFVYAGYAVHPVWSWSTGLQASAWSGRRLRGGRSRGVALAATGLPMRPRSAATPTNGLSDPSPLREPWGSGSRADRPSRSSVTAS